MTMMERLRIHREMEQANRARVRAYIAKRKKRTA